MDYATELIEIVKVGLSDIVTNCINVAAAVLPIGLGLLGLGKIFDVAKRFFNKSIGEYEDSYEYYSSGKRKSDYDYDING